MAQSSERKLLTTCKAYADCSLPGELRSSCLGCPLDPTLKSRWREAKGRLVSGWRGVVDEVATLRRVLYKSMNQHKGSKHLKHLQEVWLQYSARVYSGFPPR